MEDKKGLNLLVGANIKREREKAGFTQDQFSELLGIGSKSLSAIERGVVGVSLVTLLNICEFLHVSPNIILLEQSRQNDVDGLTEQLRSMTPAQFDIASEILGNLLKAFRLKEQ